MGSLWLDEPNVPLMKSFWICIYCLTSPRGLGLAQCSTLGKDTGTAYGTLSISEQKPTVASSEREEMSCPLDLLSLHFIYSVKSQQWHIRFGSNLIMLFVVLNFIVSVLFIVGGLIVGGWPVPFRFPDIHTLVNYPGVAFAQWPIVKAVHPSVLQQTSGTRIWFG